MIIHTTSINDDVEESLSALFYLAPPLERGRWLQLLMGAHDGGVSEADARKWSEQGENFDDADFRTTWRSITRGPITKATLFRVARDAGWKPASESVKLTWAEIKLRKETTAALADSTAATKVRNSEHSASWAKRLWDAATPVVAAKHPYLQRKGVLSYGLRIGRFEVIRRETGEVITLHANALIIPIMDRKRKVWSLQAIPASAAKNKLFLRGGAIRGHFHPLGTKPLQHYGREVFVLAEGYATCASLHQATDHLVLCCFGASNLLPVAQQVRESKPNAVILFAADNDQWNRKPDGTPQNPGLEAATKAAGAVAGVVAIPPFSAEDASCTDDKGDPIGPTDFNDWHRLHGGQSLADVIAEALARTTARVQPEVLAEAQAGRADASAAPGEANGKPALPVDTGSPSHSREKHFDIGDLPESASGFFRVMGVSTRGGITVYHLARRQLLHCTKRDFSSDLGFVEVAPIVVWENAYPKTNGSGFNRTAAFQDLYNLAVKRGVFNLEDRQRGRGAWLDNGRVVFHHGDHLTVDGVKTELPDIASRYIYSSAPELASAPTPATDEQGQWLLDVAKMARWSNPASALIVAGWTFLAPICGALRWRPHIWITGPAGSGKTSIVEGYVGALLGNIGLRLDAGSSTAAGTRQTLSCDARPVILDESESDDERGRQRIAELLTIARGASSASGAKIVKGTTAGVPLDFHVRSSFCMSSIGIQLEKTADTSRFALLSLRPGVEVDGRDHWPVLKSKLHEIEIDTEWPGRLLARALDMMSVLLESISVFCDAVAEKHGGDRRVGDQFGTLLAGAWCLTSSTLATSAQAQKIVAGIDWRDYLDRAEAPDADQCLRQILDGQVIHKGEHTRVRTLLRMSLGEVVEGLEIDNKTALRLLQDNDITITKKTHLAIAYGSTAITRMLRGTRFATDWQGHIKRAAGYEALSATSFGPNGKERAHGLPLVSLGLVEDGPPI